MQVSREFSVGSGFMLLKLLARVTRALGGTVKGLLTGTQHPSGNQPCRQVTANVTWACLWLMLLPCLEAQDFGKAPASASSKSRTSLQPSRKIQFPSGIGVEHKRDSNRSPGLEQPHTRPDAQAAAECRRHPACSSRGGSVKECH